MRLDKYLHDMGFGTRKELRKGIAKGHALVDGAVTHNPGVQVTEACQVVWQGKEVLYQRFHTILLYKPAGVITATKDRNTQTVVDLLPLELKHMNVTPVGRLDKDTTGLLLLTNDGALSHLLTRPASGVKKVYHARYTGTLLPETAQLFCTGIDLGDFTTAPAHIAPLREDCVEVTLTEGKFHQVKRMLAAVGGDVIALKRVAFGPLQLPDDLAPGEWRHVDDEEIAALHRAAHEGA